MHADLTGKHIKRAIDNGAWATTCHSVTSARGGAGDADGFDEDILGHNATQTRSASRVEAHPKPAHVSRPSPLHQALKVVHVVIITLFLFHAQFQFTHARTHLFFESIHHVSLVCSQNKQWEAALLLLEQTDVDGGINTALSTDGGNSPLHMLAECGDYDKLSTLLETIMGHPR